MKKRLKGLLCLWLAVLIVAAPAVRAVSAAETDAEGNPYLYVYRGETDLSQRDQVRADDQEIRKTTFNFDESLNQQSNIMNEVLTPEGKEIDGWKVWRYYSGFVYTPNMDNQPDVLKKNGKISLAYYETITNNDSSSYILLEPVFRQQLPAIILPEAMVGYEINSAEWITSGENPAYTFTVTIDATHEAADNFAVSANGVELQPTKMVGTYESTYVIENITEAQTISVVGVVDRITPQLKIQFADGVYWDNFHQVVGVTGVYKYFNEAQTITLSTSTESLKSNGIWYKVASGDLLKWDEIGADNITGALEAAVETAGGWEVYENPIKLENDGTYVVYAKAESSESKTNYANTEMFVIDTVAPQIWSETAGNGIDGLRYEGDLTFSVEDANLDYVTVDGKEVELVGNEYTITADGQRHTIEARDKAKNATRVSVQVDGEYTISKTAAEGGSFTVMCEDEEVTVARPNYEIAVSASADEGYSVDEIIVTKTGDESTRVTVTDGSFIMPAYPVTVTVNFREKAYLVTLPASPMGAYTVTPADGSVSPALHGSDFVFTVTIADGYKASDSYSVSANGTVLTPEIDGNTYTYTIENITEEQEIMIRGIVSATAPSIAIEVENDSTQWTDFLPKISSDYFFNEPITIDMSATEADSGTELTDIRYYIADGDLFPVNRRYTEQEIEETIAAAGGWDVYNGPIELADDGTYVVYVKAEDSDSNTNYANTERFVIDKAEPEIRNETSENVIDGMQYKGDLTFSVNDANLDYVTVDDERVELVENKYTITADCKRHTIQAWDKAGNGIAIRVYVYDEYEIGKTAAEGGSFTVMCKDKEVTVAEPGSEIVVTASAGEGYLVDEIIVTKTGDENTQVTVTEGKFTMPSYPVTVTVNFQKKAYPVTLPASPTVGYTVASVEGSVSPAFHGSDFVFTVTIADGYKASGSYSVSANGTVLIPVVDGNTYTYTIENITEEQKVTVRGIVSAAAPSIAIRVENDSTQWTDFLPEISTDYFFNKAATIDVSATEADSDTELTDIWYYLADGDLFPEDRDYTEQEIEETIAAAGSWKVYNDPIELADDGTYVVYVKAEDPDSNTNYANTERFVIDKAAPEIWNETAGDVIDGMQYKGDLTFSVNDANLDYVTVDDEKVELVDNEYTITADCRQHTIEALDKAGNATKISVYVYDEYEIGKTAAEGGSFTVKCDDKEVTAAEPGSEIVVTASAEEGYLVAEIIVTKTGDENTQVTVTDGKFTMPSYPVTVAVNFQKKAYPVTLPALPTVGYTVTPVDGSVSPAFHGSDFVFTVTIADGYKASDSYSVSANGTVLTPEINGNTYTYTIENITEEQKVTVSGIVSAAAPSIAVTVENDSTQWTDFLPEISFDYFFNKAIAINVSATEADSDTKLTKIWYYIADGDLFPEDREYTAQEIEEAVSKWTEYTDGITLAENGKHVIYIKVTDSNGNVAYANTAGIVIDTVIPTIFGVENGGVYYGDTLIRASDDNLDTVLVDGIAVQLANGAYTITADNQTHTVTVTDKAGNQISYELYTFETWVRDGIQTAGTLRLTAGTGYRLGSGRWKVSGDETVYEGGNSFYVAESGSYVFVQQ